MTRTAWLALLILLAVGTGSNVAYNPPTVRFDASASQAGSTSATTCVFDLDGSSRVSLVVGCVLMDADETMSSNPTYGGTTMDSGIVTDGLTGANDQKVHCYSLSVTTEGGAGEFDADFSTDDHHSCIVVGFSGRNASVIDWSESDSTGCTPFHQTAHTTDDTDSVIGVVSSYYAYWSNPIALSGMSIEEAGATGGGVPPADDAYVFAWVTDIPLTVGNYTSNPDAGALACAQVVFEVAN